MDWPSGGSEGECVSYTALDSIQWGGVPKIGVSFGYDSRRSGSAMQYRIYVTVAPLTGASYFGYPIYLSVTVDGGSVCSGQTLKAASPSRWSSAIEYDSGWVTAAGAVGTAPLGIRLYSGSGSARDDSYGYALPVERVEDIGDFSLTAGDAVIGQTGTLTLTRPGYGYSFTFSYALGAASGTLSSAALRTVSSSAGRVVYQWTVPESLAGELPETTHGTGTVTVAAYYPPAITASMAARCAADGTEKDDGAYLKVKCAAQCADVQGHNTVVLRARFRPVGGAWSGYTALLPGAEQLLGGGLDSGTSYEVELSAEDTVGNVRVVRYTAATSRVTLHLRAGGMGAAFGKYAEQEALECVWPAVFYGDVAVSGALTVNGQTVEAMLFPVGSVRLTDSPAAPETPAGAVWESVETGIAGVYGWRRTT